MSAASGPARFTTALTVAVVLATALAWVLTENAALALAPLAATLVVRAMLLAPPHRVALVVFFVALIADNPKEMPFEGRWASPLSPLGLVFHETLNNLTGVGALRFAVSDLVVLSLLLLALLRARRPDVVPPPRALHRVLQVAFLAVVWIELWGLARGGSFRATLWQVRAFMWLPALAFIFANSLRGPRDHAALGKAILAAALIKAALGVYFLEVVCRRQGYWPSYATTHSDTLVFVSAVVIAGTTVLTRPTLRRALFAAAIVVPVLAGIIVNSRRLAYVGIVGSGAAIYLVLPSGPLLRSATRTLVAMGPVAALYLALGWTSDLAIFGPARKVASLFSKEDRSAAMRDIENYNLILTWKQHPFTGLGFGHEYSELTSPEGAAQNFPLYRYIAHNSVLWLEATGGVFGFTAFWILPAALAYFAARAHGAAREPLDRAAALTALSVSVTFVIQAYGDMGMTSWPAMFLMGAALAVASKLSVATGAFPR